MIRLRVLVGCVVLSITLGWCGTAAAAPAAPRCTDERTVHAYVVALDQVITLNRLGATMPQGMMFALANDVFPTGTNPQQQTLQNSCRFKSCAAGSVMLGTYKRPRPLVLRVDEGDCLDIHFVNLLSPTPQPNQGKTTKAGPHVQGLNWVRGPQDDASFVGNNPSSLFPPGSTPGGATGWTEYELYAEHEGSYLLYSTADDWTPVPGGGDGGTLAQGLFGAVTVQPSGHRFHENERGEKITGKERPWQAEFYRSQVTEQDVCLASADQKAQGGTCYRTKPEELPTLDFQALYPAGSPREFLPILNMVCTKQLTPDAITHGACLQNELVHGDLTAMITGPSHQQPGFALPQPRAFPNAPNPDQQPPSLRPNYAYPDRLQPYREFTIIYHESFQVTQAFPGCFNKLGSLDAAGDNFGINYGMSGLSAEVLANRLAVGPVSGCTDCKFEEFFLSSWALGDPAMNVDWPTTGCVDNNCKPKACAKASQAYYPDDPSNVYHAYIADHVRFRILHGGSDLHHLHHQHAQQWLGTPNSPDGDYLDSQSIGPGSAFTLEMVYNGTGNVNQVVGDSIFHCHFYPHFASGMWSLWRSHDVFEGGTILVDGKPANRSNPATGGTDFTRALPDGEIAGGTPTPAVVPLPTLPMAPMPAAVQLQGVCSGSPVTNCLTNADCGSKGTCGPLGSRYCVMEGSPASCISELVTTKARWDEVKELKYRNPGYPFFVPGIGGSRAPHPPLDFAYACAESGKICDPTKSPFDPLKLETVVAAKQLEAHPDYVAPIFKGDSAVCGPGEGACEPMDGGLPRSVTALGPPSGWITPTPPSNIDFSKEIEEATAISVPEPGTLLEKVAMATHAQRFHYDSKLPDGTTTGTCSDNQAPCSANTTAGRWQCANAETATCSAAGHINFVLNGLGPEPGAPYADPCINFDRNGGVPNNILFRSYLAADLQLDAVFNKEGWHFPQQRMLSLWGDARDFFDRKKPPEPLFMRVNSYDCMTYVLANLVPNVYELDDFQVRTPTDVLGQHIHLVKFDVTSSDGAGNGWNYEDGTFAPNEVTERIRAINNLDGIYIPPAVEGGGGNQTKLKAKYIKFFGPGPGATPGFDKDAAENGAWLGSQATIQRWYDDPLYNNTGRCELNLDVPCTLPNRTATGICPGGAVCATNMGHCSDNYAICTQNNLKQCKDPSRAKCEPAHDRTIRTVFTHDHFGPSTHQQAGLYAGVVAEPKGSVWRANETGKVMGGYDSATGNNYPGRSSTLNGVTVQDGGPTSWQAVIETPLVGESYREFLLEVQDSTLTYKPFAVGGNPFEALRLGVCAKNEGPCGFCSYTGRCSNDRSKICRIATFGTAQDTSRCGAPAGTKVQCLYGLVDGAPEDPNLVACTPTDLDKCFGKDQKAESCNFVTGVPAYSWQSGGPIDSPLNGKLDSRGNGVTGVEAITFSGATNNFSFNYRNEPLYPRTNDPATGKPLSGWQGDLGYVFSSLRFCDHDPTRVCHNDAQCGAGDHCGARANPRGKVCSDNLAVVCTSDSGCGAGGTCQDAGFCASNYQLCTVGNTSLCAGSGCAAGSDGFPYPPLTAGIHAGDPFTPLLRAYAADDVQIRVLIGAHINPHNFTLHGLDWLTEPSFVDSGWRNSQVMGISEHYNLLLRLDPEFTLPPGAADAKHRADVRFVDYLYQPGAAAIEQASGNWGLIRAYHEPQVDLAPLPQNNYRPGTEFLKAPVCEPGAPQRDYTVVAMTAQQAVGGPLVYNQTMNVTDPQGLVFLSPQDPEVKCAKRGDYSSCRYSGRIKPLVLRAAAGDCVKVTLYNALPDPAKAYCSTQTFPNSALTCPYGSSCTGGGTCQVYGYCSNDARTACDPGGFPHQCPAVLCKNQVCTNDASKSCTLPSDCPALTCNPLIGVGIASQQINQSSVTSLQVGLRPQLVIYDSRSSDGTTAGFNPVETAAPGGQVVYTWYAGHVELGDKPGDVRYVPIEFGAANLMPPDQLNQYLHGLFGGLIIEPRGANWQGAMGTTATVKYTDYYGHPASFREFVVLTPDDTNNLTAPPLVPNYNQVNYGTEPLRTSTIPPRYCNPSCNANDVSCVLATTNPNTQVYCKTGSSCAPCTFEPQTPVFTAHAGDQVRFRLLHPGGTNTNEVFELYGHSFSKEPFMTPLASCAAPTTQTNLAASQFMGTFNLCGSLPFLPGTVKTRSNNTTWGEPLGEWKAALQGHGPSNHFDVLIDSAGGPLQVCGDYLYRTYPADHFNAGMWGIFRVEGCKGGKGGGSRSGGK